MAEAAGQQIKWMRRQFRLTVAEIVALIVTIVFTGIAALAARKAANSASEAVRIAINNQRPWIGVDSIKTYPDSPQEGKEFRIKITLKNAGLSPAQEFRAYFNAPDIRAGGDYSGVPLRERNDGVSKGLLIPDGTFSIDLTIDAAKFDGPQIARIFSGDPNGRDIILISGRSDYLDVTGDKRELRHTTICMFYDIASSRFGYCTTGNEAT